MLRIIPALFILSALAAAQPFPAFMVDETHRATPAMRYQSRPAVATDGDLFFAVWSDARVDAACIFGARVSHSGVLLDSAGIPVTKRELNGTEPSVAFDGENFLVTWNQKLYRGAYNAIFCVRVTPSGHVLDTLGVRVSETVGFVEDPVVASDDSVSLVVWEDRPTSGTWVVRGARVSREGLVVDTANIQVAVTAGRVGGLRVAATRDAFLVVWREEDTTAAGDKDVRATLIGRDGQILTPQGIEVCTTYQYQSSPDVASDGSDYFVVWRNDFEDEPRRVFGARVSGDGAVVDTGGFMLVQGTTSQQHPAVAFDGTNYVVTWLDLDGQVRGTRVSPRGVVLDPDGIDISFGPGVRSDIALASGQGMSLAAWTLDLDDRFSDLDIEGVRVNSAGQVLDPEGIDISLGVARQGTPDVASDGRQYFVVWQDCTDKAKDILGSFVTRDGPVSGPVTIAEGGLGYSSPAVCHGDDNYLVFWETRGARTGDVQGRRVSKTGVVLDTVAIDPAQNRYSEVLPVIGFDGENYLVLWMDWGVYWDIIGTRISPDGEILDPGLIPVATGAGTAGTGAIAHDGTNWFAVWGWAEDPFASGFVYGSRIDSTGTVLDPDGILLFPERGRGGPDVAFDGNNYLVAWLEQDGDKSIECVRVRPDGVVLDSVPIVVSLPTMYQTPPTVAFDGRDFVLVWHQGADTTFSDLHGARVSPTGEVLERFVVASDWGNQLDPVMVRGVGSELMLVYSSWTERYQGRAVYTDRIWASTGPFPGVQGEPNLRARPARWSGPTILRAPDLARFEGRVHDAAGRDVTASRQELAPGVYFLRETPGPVPEPENRLCRTAANRSAGASGFAASTRKFIVTR